MSDEKKSKLSLVGEGRHLTDSAIRDLFPTFANLDMTDEAINALTPLERQELISRLDYRKKYQLLRAAEDWPELVRSLSPEDLFFTMEAAGRTDAVDLLFEAAPAQITHIFDMTCWEADTLDASEMLDWFGYLMQLDPEQAVFKLREIDPEIVVLMLSKHIQVHRYEWYEDRNYIDDDSLFSFDDLYLFELIDPESTQSERLAVFLQMLYKIDYPLYRYLMEVILWEMSSNVEELAYRAHCDRLSDHGYPEYLDALQLFAPLNPETAKKQWQQEQPRKTRLTSDDVQLPAYYGHLLEAESFLTRILSGADSSLRETWRGELVLLANRLIVARKSIHDLDRIRDALDEAHRTLSLGMEYLAEGDVAQGEALATQIPFSQAFRVGYSLIRLLHRRAAAFQERYVTPTGRGALKLISSPTREVLQGLMRQPPLYFAGAEGDGAMISRPFTNLSELERAKLLLTRLEFLFDLHFRILAVDPKKVVKGIVDIGLDPLDPDLRFVKLFLTLYVNATAGKELAYTPINREDFTHFLETHLEPQGNSFHLQADVARRIGDWLKPITSEEPETTRYLAGEWAQRSVLVLGQISTQVKRLDPQGAISLSQVLLLA